MRMSRRDVFATAAALAASTLAPVRAASAQPPALGSATPFDQNTVIDLARRLARRDYQPAPTVPDAWTGIDYDQYRSIRYRPAAALWRGTDGAFEAQFFAPGFYFRESVQVNVVEDGLARRVVFDLAHFNKADNVPRLPNDPALGFSGFRLHTALNSRDYLDEFLVFQGASYFRGVAKGQGYGLSARGLAINTAEPEGEEFPVFRDFWIERPRAGATSVRVHALLDSPGVAGAYRFDVTPGEATVMDVRATLFPRVDLRHVGIAPLTSMFLFDETNRMMFDDFRPVVHDSDGILIANGAGEWLWRPLANPKRLQVSQFLDNNPRGFGLMQRTRSLGAFSDLEARYERRPSTWIEPKGDWGRGAVSLVEIPTRREINDNIVAYWRPNGGLAAGTESTIDYRLSWCWEPPVESGLARVANTRMGARPQFTNEPDTGERLMVIDFVAAAGQTLPEPDAIMPNVWARPGAVGKPVVQENPDTGGIRLAFTFDPGEADMAELRAQLRQDGKPLSEVWLYRWTI